MKSSILVALLIASSGAEPQKTPPDLAVGWTDSGEPVTGVAGTTVEIPHVIRNIGGTDAFAFITRVGTTLGMSPKVRFQPGPAAGKSLTRKLSLALAKGMRELCIDVNLQNVSLDAPPDPNLKNNRACRPVVVRESN